MANYLSEVYQFNRLRNIMCEHDPINNDVIDAIDNAIVGHGHKKQIVVEVEEKDVEFFESMIDSSEVEIQRTI